MQERWWTWAASEAKETNPIADASGEFCSRNQPADVWFFANTFGGEARRQCLVPAGLSIVVPLVNLRSDRPADCAEFMGSATGGAELDAKPVAARRIDGEPITITGTPGNAITETDAPVAATACGMWVQIPPPAVGQHELTISGRAKDLDVTVHYAFEIADNLQ